MARIYTIRGSQGDDASTAVDPNFNHVVVGVSYFTDNTYTTIATPIAGTIAVEGRINGNSGWSPLTDSPMDCTNPADSVNTSIPLQEIRLVATGLDAGVFYQAVITGNAH